MHRSTLNRGRTEDRKNRRQRIFAAPMTTTTIWRERELERD